MKRLLTLIFILTALNAMAQKSVIGKWKTIDDNTGEAKSIIEIYERGGKLFGKVVKILDPKAEPDPVCDECPADDPRYNKKIIGMEIIQSLVKDGDEYSEGTILDPEPGKIYRCKLWLEGEDLMVRGYWGPFYRTQTWKRVN
jgi:uncharacterized protein (DUF2147 family)